jgi:hypothetical protein
MIGNRTAGIASGRQLASEGAGLTPALAGNTAVIKPSEYTSAPTLEFGRLIEPCPVTPLPWSDSRCRPIAQPET